MKKTIARLISIWIVLLLFISLPACFQDFENTQNISTDSSSDTTPISAETVLHSPVDSSEYVGLNYLYVENLLREAGFTQITFCNIDDIDSSSDISDGSVESVSINGAAEYTSAIDFSIDAPIVITYHNIPKITVPIASQDAISNHYMDVGKLFYDAGFTNINTDEAYNSDATKEETKLTVDGSLIEAGAQLPFDSQISVIGQYPTPKHSVQIIIDFEANWIFSKYDVIVTLNGAELGTLPHGEGTTYDLSLPIGVYELIFTNVEDEDVSGSISFNVTSQTAAKYHISCHNSNVKVEELTFTQELTSGQLLMPFSSNHYLRKNYEDVVSELKALGFTKVSAKSTTDHLWTPSPVNSVVGISIGNVAAFERDNVFAKNSSIVVYYHVADFSFDQPAISVTEKETFNIAYTMTSGDSLESLTFEIDNLDVLQRNDDGSYTALVPGTAKVTVSSGGHIYSSCTVEVSEIIVPIDHITFAENELNVVVGSTFDLVYSIFPENANYTDMTITISTSGIEQNENFSFYANEAGDAEITFYQEDRLVGSCTIHASIVDIEELVINEAPTEVYIGDSFDISFNLSPAAATCKGIVVESSNSNIANVVFDERGNAVAKVTGISAGETTITIIIPNGTKYTHPIVVNEIPPTEISITNTQPNARIEVGTPILLDVAWNPTNTSVKELTWETSNNKVIKVNDDGTLEAVGVGTADITAKHKSGVSSTISITVEPTLVTKIKLISDQDFSKDFIKGDKFTITASVLPQNATNQTVTYTSNNEAVVKVSEKGVVTAVGVGTATITATSPDGPTEIMQVTVKPAPQKFRITWSASLVKNNHVGSNWSKSFEVNDESFSSGSTIILAPESTFTIRLTIQENDSKPESGSYFERIKYSEDLCKNGHTVSDTIYVRENGGRYSGNHAEWTIKITITPIN